MNTFSLLDDFLEYLILEKNRSELTRETYERRLLHFLHWLKNDSPKSITLNSIRNYRLHLNTKKVAKKSLGKTTQTYYLIAIRSFLKYLAKRNISSLSPESLEIGKIEQTERDFLENNELERLLSSPSKKTLAGLRDQAILELLFSAGLRVSELVSLNKKNLNLERQEMSIRGKGKKLRIVFISDFARNALAQYLKRRTDIDKALFIRLRYKALASFDDDLRLTTRSIQRIVKNHATSAGIVKNVHPHTLRHTFATDLLRNGADIRSVQIMLGHSSIITTQLYTHITNNRLKEVYKKYHRKKASSDSDKKNS
jgi:site-specific recombinase XerD